VTATPNVVITIDDTGVVGAPGDLVFSATPGVGEFGIVEFREIASEANITRVGGAGNIHGEGVPTEWSYQEANLAFSFVTDVSATEAESRAYLATVRAFLGRLRYSVTITVSGSTAETWVGYAGSLTPAAGRSRNDLTDSNPVWNVVIPCHPVRS
jgi:hypothetical protein